MSKLSVYGEWLVQEADGCTCCGLSPHEPGCGYEPLVKIDELKAAFKAAGYALVELPSATTEDIEDEDRPKDAGDYLKRDDTASEVWVEGLPGSDPYVFFGRRYRGPSYMPAEYARDVAAALLAAADAAEVTA